VGLEVIEEAVEGHSDGRRYCSSGPLYAWLRPSEVVVPESRRRVLRVVVIRGDSERHFATEGNAQNREGAELPRALLIDGQNNRKRFADGCALGEKWQSDGVISAKAGGGKALIGLLIEVLSDAANVGRKFSRLSPKISPLRRHRRPA
jgi:hypothetical protein